MSDLQDLIHKTTIDCIERGRRQERDRVLGILSHEIWHHIGLNENGVAEHRAGCSACAQIALIKAEK